MPLVIEIPPGTPPMARLDIDQHDEARVVLKTNQPDMPEMVLGVRFAVERYGSRAVGDEREFCECVAISRADGSGERHVFDGARSLGRVAGS